MPTAGAGVSVETGWRVGVTENMDDRAAQAVGTSALLNKAATRSASVAGGWICIGWAAWWDGGVIFEWGWAAGRRPCGL